MSHNRLLCPFDCSAICMSPTLYSACQITSASFCLSLSSHLSFIPPLLQCNSRLPPRSPISRHLNRLHCHLPAALLSSVFRQRTMAAHSFQWTYLPMVYGKSFWLHGHICIMRPIEHCAVVSLPIISLRRMRCIGTHLPIRMSRDDLDVTLRKNFFQGNSWPL